MAPIPSPSNSELEAALADYFFIAGIESSQITDEKYQALLSPTSPPPVETTIEENEVLDLETDAAAAARPKSADASSTVDSVANKRRSRMSYEARKSISSLLTSDSNTASNRSSATIKGVPPGIDRASMSDADFDTALRKFAAERETFVDEMHFSAGTLPRLPKRKKSKAHRIFTNSTDEPNLLKSGVGSLRRKLSTMNSLKRQPSLMRQGMYKSKLRKQYLNHPSSFCPYFQTSQWLQLCHTKSSALAHRSKHTSSKTTLRSCTPRPLPSQKYDRRP